MTSIRRRTRFPWRELFEIDRYALANMRALLDACRADYDRYEFHLVVQRLQTYCSEDLGGFYLDVLKDRLYTAAKASRARRSAQTALVLIRDTLLGLMAPILSFTAEEAWRIVHPGDPTIFVRTWGDALPAVADGDALLAKWPRILAVRGAVLKELEALQDRRTHRLVAAGRSHDLGARRRLRGARERWATTCASS